MHTLQTRQAGMAVTVFFNFLASFAIGVQCLPCKPVQLLVVPPLHLPVQAHGL